MTSKMTYYFALVISLLVGVHGTSRPQRTIHALTAQNDEMYNCVDFYKQSAFNHPLLKDRVPKVNSNLTTSIRRKFNSTIGGCPDGTVPISNLIAPGPRPEAKVHCYAVVRTVLDDKKKRFFGSNANMNIYKPQVEGYQWSAGRIKLMNGPDSIEAGWIVFPDYYKDNEAHFYARFMAGSIECFNTDCPGFVQVATDMPLGTFNDRYSIINGIQVVSNLTIEKHSDDGNWWLSTTYYNDINIHQIGYWPGSLFTALSDAAAQVEWGGEINNPGAVSPNPAMGSSLQATYDPSKSAYFSDITVVDKNSKYVMPDGTEKFYDCPSLYTVKDWGDQGGDYGRTIFYGGSPPDCCPNK